MYTKIHQQGDSEMIVAAFKYGIDSDDWSLFKCECKYAIKRHKDEIKVQRMERVSGFKRSKSQKAGH